VFNYLEDLADKGLSAADYALKVRKLYDVLVEDTGEPEEVRIFLLSRVSAQRDLRKISQQHRELVVKLFPGLPRRKRGRPSGVLGKKAYDKRIQLHLDWIGKKALRPAVTKEQFAKELLGIKDGDLAGEYEFEHRARMDALLQDLKPARMKQLDDGQRRAIETVYPLLVTYPKLLAQKWREASAQRPSIAKEDFLLDFLGWPRDRKRHPMEAEMLSDYLEMLDRGERQLAIDCSAPLTKKARPSKPKGKRSRAAT
jgi:hypothetical protein